ncbi:hypothetical protein G3545_07100 [Starkeya sp. ORNL1]|uniref:hypothetical protein n=1 Tax=Starkeya sp. ORNL1 TaxID=2709380 RepID=UPI001462862E|nr:hypothetical protein [Starkeya sp. ORNL1]QJP13444.1 hypothetical protein G3545_07100 [Starkeya sp. ORNL1]
MPKQDTSSERFMGYVELAALDRPFVSKAEERRLLEQGISQFGLDPTEARGIVLYAAQQNGIRLEREVDGRMVPILDRFGGKRKKLGKKKFREAAALYNELAGGVLSEEEARLYVKQVMEQNKFRPKRSMLMSRRWYDKIGKEKKPTSILAALPFRTV